MGSLASSPGSRVSWSLWERQWSSCYGSPNAMLTALSSDSYMSMLLLGWPSMQAWSNHFPEGQLSFPSVKSQRCKERTSVLLQNCLLCFHSGSWFSKETQLFPRKDWFSNSQVSAIPAFLPFNTDVFLPRLIFFWFVCCLFYFAGLPGSFSVLGSKLIQYLYYISELQSLTKKGGVLFVYFRGQKIKDLYLWGIKKVLSTNQWAIPSPAQK